MEDLRTELINLINLWLNYRPEMNFDSVCAVMNVTGIDGVILNAPTPDDYRKAIPIARMYGIEVYAWLWTTNPEHDRDVILKESPDWFSVNRKGESLADTKAYVDYYKFMCPALPEVREYIKKKIVSYCEVEGLNGIAIDYHRFVDVILPTTLWSRYGIVQDKEYPEFDFGYHPAMIKLFKEKYGYDPRELEDPSTDEKWLQFRGDQITEVANEIAEVVHSYADSARASRAASKVNLEVSVPKVVNTNPFENTGIMNAVNMHMLAYLSMANASKLPELKKTDQIIKDNNQANVNLSGYELNNEYGATKCYQVTEQNSIVDY